MDTLIWILLLGSTVWVYYDAKSHGIEDGQTTGLVNMGAGGWAISVLLLWVIAFPAYLIRRDELIAAANGEPEPIPPGGKPSLVNNVAKYAAAIWTVFCVAGVVMGLVSTGQRTSGLTGDYALAGAGLGITIGLGMWFTAWLVVTLPAALIFFLTRNNVVTIEHAPAQQSEPRGKTKACPYCAERIQEEAIYCRFCQKDLIDVPTTQKAKPQTESPKIQASDWLEKGRQHMKNGEHKEAVAALDNAAMLAGHNSDIYYLRAAAYAKMKDQANMIVDLKRAANMGHQKAGEALTKLEK